MCMGIFPANVWYVCLLHGVARKWCSWLFQLQMVVSTGNWIRSSEPTASPLKPLSHFSSLTSAVLNPRYTFRIAWSALQNRTQNNGLWQERQESIKFRRPACTWINHLIGDQLIATVLETKNEETTTVPATRFWQFCNLALLYSEVTSSLWTHFLDYSNDLTPWLRY